jgi:hypothetical protein
MVSSHDRTNTRLELTRDYTPPHPHQVGFLVKAATLFQEFVSAQVANDSADQCHHQTWDEHQLKNTNTKI